MREGVGSDGVGQAHPLKVCTSGGGPAGTAPNRTVMSVGAGLLGIK